MSKKYLASNQESPDEISRPNLADIPEIDDMLALYEKVLVELDADIASQQEFSKGA